MRWMPAKISVFRPKEINKERGMIRDFYGFYQISWLIHLWKKGCFILFLFFEASRHQGDHTPTIGMPWPETWPWSNLNSRRGTWLPGRAWSGHQCLKSRNPQSASPSRSWPCDGINFKRESCHRNPPHVYIWPVLTSEWGFNQHFWGELYFKTLRGKGWCMTLSNVFHMTNWVLSPAPFIWWALLCECGPIRGLRQPHVLVSVAVSGMILLGWERQPMCIQGMMWVLDIFYTSRICWNNLLHMLTVALRIHGFHINPLSGHLLPPRVLKISSGEARSNTHTHKKHLPNVTHPKK